MLRLDPYVSPKIAWTFEPSVLDRRRWRWPSLYVLGLAPRRERPASRIHLATVAWRCSSRRLALAILAALVSPIDELGDQLMLMHMVQHILLLDLVPIALILGLNKVLLRPVTRRLNAVERRAGFLGHPVFAVAAYVGFMWAWHIPAMYDAALHNTTVHAFEHLCLLAAGTLYWWHILSPIRGRMRLSGLGPVTYMASTKLLVGLLGIVLAFAPHVIYPFYAHKPHFWGLTPLEDQSLAGVAMALEQSIVMGIALVYVFVQMLTESEREAQRAERYEVA